MLQQKTNQIEIKIQNKDGHFLRINQTGLYEINELTRGCQKKLFCLNSKLRVRIIKAETINDDYRFTVRFTEQNITVLGVIEGSQLFERFLRVIGFFNPINGLNQIATVFRKIGEGSFAQVFEVITNYQSHFAVKCFDRKQIQICKKSSKAFHNEISILKKLNSPFIVSYKYLFQTETLYYLSMQFFAKTLKDKLNSKLLVKQQKSIMKQLMLALVEMKNKNVIHRDLKPQNIMIRINKRGQQQCVVIDFGLSTFADAAPYIYFRCGTPGFLAPQIANLDKKDQKQNCSADMFSLGCIFYKILTGHYLFSGKIASDILRANKKCIYRPNVFESLSVNDLEKRLMKRMLDPNPNTRITPTQALKDPYFQDDIDDNDQIPEQQCKIEEKVKKMSLNPFVNRRNSIDSLNSIRLNTSQVYKQRKRSTIQDSCLTFQFKSNQLSEKQNTLRTPSHSNKKNGKKRTVSQRKSRFSELKQHILV